MIIKWALWNKPAMSGIYEQKRQTEIEKIFIFSLPTCRMNECKVNAKKKKKKKFANVLWC